MIKITLETFNENTVILLYQTVAEDGYVLRNHRMSYSNSEFGRSKVQNEVEEPYKSIIFMLWGDKPTLIEGSFEDI